MRSANTATAVKDRHDGMPLREQVEQILEQLSRRLLTHAPAGGGARIGAPASAELQAMQRYVRFLGQLSAAWSSLPQEALPATGAGFGSTVDVVDADDDSRATYTLMAGPVIDIDADQVSLASPVGQALLGARPGDIVTVEAPVRRRRLRVLAVRTLQDRIREVMWAGPAP